MITRVYNSILSNLTLYLFTKHEMSATTSPSLPNLPKELICIIASYLPFRQFMALLKANKKFRNLLQMNDLWRHQIVSFFGTSAHQNKPKCRSLFQEIYEARKMLAPAKLENFKSAFVWIKLSDKSDDHGLDSLRNILLNDTLFLYETQKSKNVHVVCSTYSETPHFIRSIKISIASKETWAKPAAPPLSAGLIFLLNEEPDLTKISKYDSFTKKQWNELSAQYSNDVQALQRAGCPVVYFEGLEKELDGKLFINFDLPCPVAKHIVLKMLRSSDESKTGMYVANLVLYGGRADATYVSTTWISNGEPDDIDMGGLDSRGDFDDYGFD